MNTSNLHPGVKRAAFAGLKAFHAFKTAHGPAQVAARVPYVGHALGLVVLVGATVAGAVSGLTGDID
jgi:hypothetical protein